MASETAIDSRREKKIYKVTLVGSLCNFFLLVFKLLAGILGHSAAMLADAVHSFSDFITDIIVILFVRISSKPHDQDHDYGHGKYETFASIVISLALLAVGISIMVKGFGEILRYARGETLEAPRMIALSAALISIVIKEILYRYTIINARKLKSPAVAANAWHHRSDALSSIGTTIGIAGAIFLGVRWRVLDPIAAVIVSLFIIKVAIKLFIPAYNELMEKSLPEETENRIIDITKRYPEISSPHNLRTRRIGTYAAIEMHVRMPGNMTVQKSHQLTQQLENDIRELMGPDTIVTIHVEPIKQQSPAKNYSNLN